MGTKSCKSSIILLYAFICSSQLLSCVNNFTCISGFSKFIFISKVEKNTHFYIKLCIVGMDFKNSFKRELEKVLYPSIVEIHYYSQSVYIFFSPAVPVRVSTI